MENSSGKFTNLGNLISVLTDYHANGAYEKLKDNIRLLENEDFAVMIRTTNLEANNYSDNLVYISENAYNFLSKSKVYPDDLIMNKIANAGAVYFMPNLGRPVSLGMNLFLIRVNSRLANPYYIYAYLKKNESYVRSFASGSTTKTITKDDVRKLKVYIPPLLEQQKIAQILSTWDKAIEKLEALIAAKQKRKKALMQQLLTGKKRFSGFEGEWGKINLMMLLKEEKGRNKNCLLSRVLSVTNHSGFVLPEEQFSRQVASNDLSNYKIVRKGQFGYNPSRINVGSFARLDDYDVGVLSPMYVVFSIDEQKLNSDFFFNWMSSHETRQRIISSTQGSVRDSVGFDSLSSFDIKLPTVKEQQKIASVLSVADTEIEINKKKLAVLKEQKKGLMQQLLTGKKRVTL